MVNSTHADMYPMGKKTHGFIHPTNIHSAMATFRFAPHKIMDKNLNNCNFIVNLQH